MNNETQTQEVEEEKFVYEVEDDTPVAEEKVETSPEKKEEEEDRTIVREKSEEPEELENYSKDVQKRINQLTAKRKQALEEAEAAFNFAQQQKSENDQLKQQLSQLNQGYTSEFGNRIESQTAQAKKLYKEAFDAGDAEKMSEASDLMAKLAIENERLRIQKARTEQTRATGNNEEKGNVEQNTPQTRQTAQKQDLDPKLQKWLDNNSWFGTDMIMTSGARAIHEQLVGQEGFDPSTDDYYAEVSKRMATEFPHKFKGGQKNTQSVAPASSGRSLKKGGKKTIELTPGQVAFAKKMRIPLEKYAQEVAKIEKTKGVA